MTHQKASATGLIINKEGKLLVIKRADDDTFLPGIYVLPGGGTDYLEHPVDGLRREIHEECGLEVDITYPLTTFSFVMEHEGVQKHTIEVIFLCFASNEDHVTLSFEHSDYKWIDFSEVNDLNTTDFLKNMIMELKEHPLVKDMLDKKTAIEDHY